MLYAVKVLFNIERERETERERESVFVCNHASKIEQTNDTSFAVLH